MAFDEVSKWVENEGDDAQTHKDDNECYNTTDGQPLMHLMILLWVHHENRIIQNKNLFLLKQICHRSLTEQQNGTNKEEL